MALWNEEMASSNPVHSAHYRADLELMQRLKAHVEGLIRQHPIKGAKGKRQQQTDKRKAADRQRKFRNACDKLLIELKALKVENCEHKYMGKFYFGGFTNTICLFHFRCS